MLSLAKALGRSVNTGRPLPDVYSTFAHSKIRFRKGTTSMIAGAPGSMKSALMLNLLIRWAQQDVRALCFSPDANEFMSATRAAAILTNTPVTKVEQEIRSGAYDSALAVIDQNVRWHFYGENIEEIDRQVRAFEQVYGCFPDLVVVDVLMKMSTEDESGNEWSALRNFISDLDTLSREAQCHVLVLHHCSESEWAPYKPQPRSSVKGKVAEFPRLMLTVAPSEGRMSLFVATVKNSYGPDDPTGNTFIQLNLDSERMRITDSGMFTGEGDFFGKTSTA